MMLSRIPLILVCITIIGSSVAVLRGDEQSKHPAKPHAAITPAKQLFTGKVVLVKDALKRRGITAFEEIEKQVALETPDGKLIPILPDWRGRAFFQDKRLRDRKVDLVGYRRPGLPYLQVLMVFTYNAKNERQYTDYWCDICSIPMYEIKPCDCCQAPIRLRFQSKPLPDYLSHSSRHSNPQPATARKPSPDDTP